MLTLLAAATTPAAGDNPYGFWEALAQGGVIAWSVFSILVFMSVVSFYILFTKLFEQNRVMSETKEVRSSFWKNNSLRDGRTKLKEGSAYRQIVDDGMVAMEQHNSLQDPVEAHEWLNSSLGRSQATINSKLGSGLSFLATVGATAPFIGLFGTVIGIYRALIAIGSSGQASIDKVAGPVGEALIMTALGLAVAVPAVLAYNWLQRRNKAISEDLSSFSNDVHGYLVSGGSVKPALATAGAARTGTTTTTTTTKPATGSTATKPATTTTTGATTTTVTPAAPGTTTGSTTGGQTGGIPTRK